MRTGSRLEQPPALEHGAVAAAAAVRHPALDALALAELCLILAAAVGGRATTQPLPCPARALAGRRAFDPRTPVLGAAYNTSTCLRRGAAALRPGERLAEREQLVHVSCGSKASFWGP